MTEQTPTLTGATDQPVDKQLGPIGRRIEAARRRRLQEPSQYVRRGAEVVASPTTDLEEFARLRWRPKVINPKKR